MVKLKKIGLLFLGITFCNTLQAAEFSIKIQAVNVDQKPYQNLGILLLEGCKGNEKIIEIKRKIHEKHDNLIVPFMYLAQKEELNDHDTLSSCILKNPQQKFTLALRTKGKVLVRNMYKKYHAYFYDYEKSATVKDIKKMIQTKEGFKDRALATMQLFAGKELLKDEQLLIECLKSSQSELIYTLQAPFIKREMPNQNTTSFSILNPTTWSPLAQFGLGATVIAGITLYFFSSRVQKKHAKK